MKLLSKDFYKRSSEIVAQDLLGKYLWVKKPEGETLAKIVETESYSQTDPSSHSFRGKNNKNRAMFGESGHAYIYFTYGMYYCFNVVTAEEGIGEGVLIRAVEPIKNIELMKKRRGVSNLYNLCNGPAKLVIAMGIGKDDYGTSLRKGSIRIYEGESKGEIEVVKAKRVGISKSADLLLRFYIKDSKFISRV